MSKWTTLVSIGIVLGMLLPAFSQVMQETDALTTRVWQNNTDFSAGTYNGTLSPNWPQGVELMAEHNWTNRNTIPTSTYGGAMAAATDWNLVVMFGGLTTGSVYINETRIYNPEDNIWFNMSPRVSPPARAFHQMVWNPLKNVFTLFGGRNTTQVFNDTWEYCPAANTWVNKTYPYDPAYIPPARYEFGMVFNRDYNCLQIFGGHDLAGNVFGDVWEYYGGYTWAEWYNQTPSPGYPACYAMGMVYIHESCYGTIVYGGKTASGEFLNLTWRATCYRNWYNQSTASPPPGRQYPMLTERGPGWAQAMLLGGNNAAGDLFDFWVYDYQSNNWWNYTGWIGGQVPTKRTRMAFAMFSPNSCVYLFGGYDGTIRNETYRMDNGAGFNRKLPMDLPPARAGAGMASIYFGAVLYGGNNSTTIFNDTWVFNMYDGNWFNNSPPMNPGKKTQGAFASNRNNWSFVFFGGLTPSGASNETWIYSYSDGQWYNVTSPTSPSARYGASIAWNWYDSTFLLFGGYNGTAHFNDTWKFTPSTNSWTNITPATASPSRRVAASLQGEWSYNRVVLFGGTNGTAYFNDTWVWDSHYSNWTQKITVASPPARAQAPMSFNMGDEYYLMIQGGVNATASVTFNDTWKYDIYYDNWTNFTNTVNSPAVTNHGIAYISNGGYFLIFGGSRGTTYFNDTYIFGHIKTTGTYTTQVMDAEQTGYNSWMSFYYESQYNSPRAWGISFQTAANNDNAIWDYVGPNGASGDSYCDQWTQYSSSYGIWWGHDGDRYLKLKATIVSWGLRDGNTLRRLELEYNRAVDSPTQISPASGAMLNTSTPVFSFFSNDKDNDMIRYKIQIYNSVWNLVGMYDQTVNITGWSLASYTPGSGANYSIQASDALPDGQYYWYVEGYDSTRWGQDTPSRTFTIDTSNPTMPVEEGLSQYTKGKSCQVNWSRSTDVAPNTGLYYYCEVDDDPAFGSPNNNTGWISGNITNFNNLADGVKYYYRVRSRDGAFNSAGWSTLQSSTQDCSSPPVPSLQPEPVFTNGTGNGLNWTAVNDTGVGGVQYYVECDDDPTFATPANSGWVSPTSASFPNLNDGKTYYYRIKSRDMFLQESGWSQAVYSIQDASSPGIPAADAEPSHTQGLVNSIGWGPVVDNGIGGVQYDVQVSEDSVFSTIRGDSGWMNGLRHTFSGLEDGKKYYYRLRSRDAFGLESTWSPNVTSTQDNSAPAVPALASLPQFTAGLAVQLKWSAVSDGNGVGGVEYTAVVSNDSAFSSVYAVSGWMNATSFTFTGLQDGVRYYCRLQSRDAFAQTSAWSVVEMTTIDASPPALPLIEDEPAFTRGLENNITWSASSDSGAGGVKYQLQWSTDPAFVTVDGDSGWTTFRTLAAGPLIDGKMYFYRVRATDALGLTTVWSWAVHSRQDNSPPAVTGITAEPRYTTGVENTLAWAPALDAGVCGIQYLVELYKDTTTSSPVKDSGWIDGTVYTFSGLEDAVTYHYRVKSRDAFGFESAWSEFATSIQDDKLPVSKLTSPVGGAAVRGTALTLSGTASDSNGIARVEVSTDGGESWMDASGNTSWTYQWTLPSDGKYTLKVRSVDKAGRTEAPARVAQITVDNTAPRISRITPSTPYTATGTPQFAADITEQGSGLNASLAVVIIDGTEQKATATMDTISYTPATALSAGDHNFSIRIQDAAGNVGESIKARLTVDLDTPVITVTAPAATVQRTNLDKLTFSGTITDLSPVKAKVTVNGLPAELILAGGAFSFTQTLFEGPNTLIFTAEDPVGHVGVNVMTINKDSRSPVISVSGPDTKTESRKVTVSGTVADASNITSVKFEVNGGAAQTATLTGMGEFSLTGVGLKDGRNTIVIRVTDEAGNTGTTTRYTTVEPATASGGASEIATPLAGIGMLMGIIGLLVALVALMAVRKRSSTAPMPRDEPGPAHTSEPTPEPEPAPQPEPPKPKRKQPAQKPPEPAPAPVAPANDEDEEFKP